MTQAGNNPSPVMLGDRKVVEIGWGYKSITPEMRARAVAERLKRLAAAPGEPPPLIVQQSDLTVDIMAGDELIASVFTGDGKLAGKDQELLAREWAEAMQRAMKDYRDQHRWQRTALRIGLALLVLVACAFLLVYVRRLMTALSLRVCERLERRAEEKPVLGQHMRQAVLPMVTPAARFLRFLLTLSILYGALQVLLFLFPATRHLAFPLWRSVKVTVENFSQGVWRHLPGLLFAVLLAWLTLYVLKFCRFFFRQVRERTITIEGFQPRWAGTTQRLVNIAIVTLAVLIAYPYIPGSDSAAFKGISIFLGVLVSLGSSGLVSNMIAGVMLTYMDEFDLGDLVKIGETIGYVRKTSVLTTTVETRKSERITLPNSMVIAADVTNFTKAGGQGLIITVTAGIGYDAPWRQVEAMMKEAALRSEGIRSQPEPFVLELSLNTFDITYELNAYLEPGAYYFATKAKLCRNILDQFNEYGVQIMTPAYERDPQESKIVPREQWYAAPARDDRTGPGTEPGSDRRAA
ncbi:MAG TPA: mechanosensitive ion channel domain-containing protein [Candidatus Angelobacter sp.]